MLNKKEGFIKKYMDYRVNGGKYEKISLLGEGGTSQVFLVRHKILGTLRAMKRISKNSINEKCYNSEVNILNMIDIDGIPVVYDVEEDLEYWYIIEQYIEGISFEEYLNNKENDALEVLGYVCRICTILHLLHTTKPYGIIYGDIKSENIIISKNGVYLIDFGNCMLTKDIPDEKNMATKEYITPEQYNSGEIGIWTDVYGIGVLIQKVYQGFQMQLYNYRDDILRIISICMEKDIKDRYTSTKIIEETITSIVEKISINRASANNNGCDRKSKKCRNSNVRDRKSLDIAIYGCRRYAGVTHLALGLTKYLEHRMSDVFYIEDNLSKDIINMLDFDNKTVCSDGIYTYKRCKILPNYGKFCTQDNADSMGLKKSVNIHDCGVYNKKSSLLNPVIVVITDIKEYLKFKYEDYILDCEDKNILYVANFSDDKGIKRLLRQRNINVLRMPYIENPFRQCKESEKFYGDIVKILMRNY